MNIHKSLYRLKLTFGKYKGSSLGYLVDYDINYLKYLVEPTTKMSPQWKQAVNLALKGESIEHLAIYDQVKFLPLKKIKANIKLAPKNLLDITFTYDSETIELFKLSIDGRKWNAKKACWTVPSAQIISVVDFFGGTKNIKADDKVKALYFAEIQKRLELEHLRNLNEYEMEIPLNVTPFPFQYVGVEFITKIGGRGVVAFSMGLGKTLVSIAYAVRHKHKTLIVCPKSVVRHWEKEILKVTGKKSCVWTTKGTEGHKNSTFHIINYDIVQKYVKDLNNLKFGLLVCDEATYLKNRKTIRAKAILGSWKERRKFPGIKTKDCIFLTGTPMLNKPIELYSLLNYLDPQQFNNYHHFLTRYGGAYNIEPKNLDELHNRAKNLIIRRTRNDVEIELPDIQTNNLYVEMDASDTKEYKKQLKEVLMNWKSTGKPSAADMPKIQSVLYDIKLSRTKEMVDELLESDRGILIFSVYLDPLYKLLEHYGENAAMVHGSMSDAERQVEIEKLSTGKAKVGLFSMGAGSMGIDGVQNQIDVGLFLNMWWTPAIHDQAAARLHRFGQKNKVQIFYMICQETIDEYMRDILESKTEIIEKVVEGKVITAGSENKSFFKEFVQKLQSEYYKELGKIDLDKIVDIQDEDVEM